MPQSIVSEAESSWLLEVRVHPHQLRRALIDDARIGLRKRPPELSPKWLYDATGSALFEAITTLPEYYPTRIERALLRTTAPAIADAVRPQTLIELGSGSSEKTRLLLDALSNVGLQTYRPIDVSEPALSSAVRRIAADYPLLSVRGVVCDFETQLDSLARGGRTLVAFLGGTVGNFHPAPRRRFLARLAQGLTHGDALLLGTDLVKDAGHLEAAYNDAQGVTSQFNLNVLSVLNRELLANFVPENFRHVARFDAQHSWIEMRLVSTRSQKIDLPLLNTRLAFAPGDFLRTEVSTKFRRAQIEAELASAGFELLHWWTDPARDYALSLSCLRGLH